MNDYTVNVPHGVTAHSSAVAYQKADSSRRSGFSIPGDLAGYDAIEHLSMGSTASSSASACS